MSNFTVLLIATSLGLLLREGRACACRNKELHNLYCEADFVVIGRISSNMHIDVSRATVYKFDVNIKRVLRDLKGIDVGKVTMHTPRTHKLCRAKLKRKQVYLLGGRKFRNDYYITKCDLVREWKSISRFQRVSIAKGRMSCKCVISPCGSNACRARLPAERYSSVCLDQTQQPCYDDYGVCIYKDNTCKWSKKSRTLLGNCLVKRSKRMNIQSETSRQTEER